ncbi:DUF1843 domain-containing protein [Gammaproteobacteria bacterium]|nr:DUF1843 domain-containing protein [Gammaproteobacteria bacterium]
MKIDLLRSRLLQLADNEIVCAVDGFDVFFCSGEDEIKRRFLSMECDCLISAERAYAHQYRKYRKFFDGVSSISPYRYVNSGSIIGYAGALRKIYKPSLSMKIQSRFITARRINKIKHLSTRVADMLGAKNFDKNLVYSYVYYTDQQHIGRYVATNPGNIRIKLDYNTMIFWCCAWEWNDILEHCNLEDNRIVNQHTRNDPLIIHVPGWRAHRKAFTNLYELQKSMKKPKLDLVLSTPDGVPEKLLELWDARLFSTVRADKTDRYGALASEILDLHNRILKDHQKHWFQVSQRQYRFDDNQDYKNKVTQILEAFLYDSKCAIVDPMLCLFTPLWISEIENPVCVFYYTEPIECAVNLQKKWRFPLQFGLALWEYYVVNALNEILQYKHLLFSQHKFRNSPVAYMEEVRERYNEIKGVSSVADNQYYDILKSEWTPKLAIPDPHQYISAAQTQLFDELESGDVDKLTNKTLSGQAEDLLFQYGNLRAGYEELKTEKDELSRQLHDQEHDAMAPVRIDGGGSVSNETGEPLVEVVVHIDGMQPQRLLSEANNPIIDTLTKALESQSTSPNEIVYLQCGETENSALYFSAGDLLGVEKTLLADG